MTPDRFAICLPATLREETGHEQVMGRPIVRSKWSYLDHPADPGGATMCGITHKVYDGWRDLCGQPRRHVREIEDHEIVAIYRAQYWDVVPCDRLPYGVDLAVMDFAVHSGPSTAVRQLQRVLGVRVDGDLGSATLGAAKAREPEELIAAYMERRRGYGRSLKNYPAFRRNWEARWNRIEKAALRAISVAPVSQSATPPPIPVHDAVGEWETEVIPAGRARDEPPATMADSTTGNTAGAIGGVGGVQMGVDASSALAKVTAGGKTFDMAAFLLELAQRPTFWMAVISVAGSAYIWLERRRRMQWS